MRIWRLRSLSKFTATKFTATKFTATKFNAPVLKSIALAALVLFSAHPSSAGVGSSLMQVANPVAPNLFELKIQNDIIFNEGGGYNLTVHGVTGLINRIMDVDFFMGTGATNFQIGAMVKYNILPDMPGQVGLSLNTGYRFMKINQKGDDSGHLFNHHLFSFGLLTSKTFSASFGAMIPYASLQVEALMKEGASRAPLSLILGNKWEPLSTAPWSFYSELGLSLRDSHFSLNLGAAYVF